jgi:hypothetical protein
MRWIKFLRALLGFVYLFAGLSAIGSLLYFVIASSESAMTFNIGGSIVQNVHWTFYIVLSLGIISQFVFVYMIYHMKKAAWLLNPRRVFSSNLSKHLKIAGVTCIVGALINRIPAFIYSIYTSYTFPKTKHLDYSMNFGFSFDSLLVIISFGIFLIITSQILKMSAVIKEENDLTI